VDELQSWDEEVFVEVFPGENLCGNFTNVEESQTIPVAATQSQT